MQRISKTNFHRIPFDGSQLPALENERQGRITFLHLGKYLGPLAHNVLKIKNGDITKGHIFDRRRIRRRRDSPDFSMSLMYVNHPLLLYYVGQARPLLYKGGWGTSCSPLPKGG